MTTTNETTTPVAAPAGGPAASPAARAEVLRGMAAALPVILGFIPIGLVLGVQARQAGLTVGEIFLLTACNFAGGSEFAALGIWTMPPHILLIVAVTFLVNCRHILMGAALAPLTRHVPRRGMLPALFFMCDESWALALADALNKDAAGRPRGFSLPFYLGAGVVMHASWALSAASGGFFGPFLGDIRHWGFDLAFPAIIIVILRGMWTGLGPALPWLASGAAAVLAYRLLPGAWYVPVGAGLGLFVAWLRAGKA